MNAGVAKAADGSPGRSRTPLLLRSASEVGRGSMGTGLSREHAERELRRRKAAHSPSRGPDASSPPGRPCGETLVWCGLHEQWRPLACCKSQGFTQGGLGGTMTHECYGDKRCRPAERAEVTVTLREQKKARAELGKEKVAAAKEQGKLREEKAVKAPGPKGAGRG